MLLSCHNHCVLVLGAGGRVGRLLAAFWHARPPVAVKPIFQTSGVIPKEMGTSFVHWRADGDVSDLPRARTVVMLWGVTPGSRQKMDRNIELGLRALEIATRIGAQRLLVASSSAVYTGAGSGPHAEGDALPAPGNTYSAAKLEMERAIRERQKAGHGPAVSILRLANVIGADSLFGNLQPGGEVILDRFASGGGPLRSYLTVDDLAYVLEVLASCPQATLPPVVNVAGSHALAMANLVEQAEGRVVWRAAPHTAQERVEMDATLLQQITGPLAQSSDPGLAIASWRRGGQG